MKFIVFIHDREDCSESIVRGIFFHDKVSIRDLVGKNKYKCKCFLE